jgi:AcrR family transcriptional regulator
VATTDDSPPDQARPSSGPVWAREPERRRTALTREAIVATAIALADAEGLAAVSIRKIAAELGARTMSLYSYIDSKDDLLDLMIDEVNAETLIEGGPPADWREALGMVAHRMRDNVRRHPWLAEILRWHPQIGPNSLRQAEQSLVAIKPLGLDPPTAAWILSVIYDYVIGHAIRELVHRAARPDAHGGLMMLPYVQRMVEGGELPNLAPVLRNGPPRVEADFESGLDWLLDSVAAEFAPS